MYIILKTAYAIIRKRKIQSILIGIVMMLISTMLFMGLSMVNQTSPFNTMFERANATESLLILSKENKNIPETIGWWEEREEVKEVISYETFMIDGAYDLNGEIEKELFLFTEYIEDSGLDLLYETEDSLGDIPTGNEMLINYNFAKNRDIEIGDSISFKYEDEIYEFKVSGMIVDPQFSTPFVNPNRCFIAPGYFTENSIENNSTIVSVKYYDIENVDDIALFETYSNEISNTASPLFIDFKIIQSTYNIIFGLIAAILLAVSIFIFIIVVFVIRSTVNNLVLQQYKEIGVKKAIGYKNNQIRYSIITYFCFIGLIASVLGTIVGLPIRNIINSGISYDIQIGMKSTLDIYLVIAIFIVTAMVFFFSYIATRQTNKIKPVQAIKYGMPERKITRNRISIAGVKKVPLNLLLAVKQLFANKRKTISTTFLITLLLYVALVISNTGSNLANSNHLASHLLGQKIGDFSIAGDTNESVDTVISKIQNIENVEQVIHINYSLNESIMTQDNRTLAVAGQVIYGNVPDDFIILADGRKSMSTKEITISSDIAKETGKSAGDYITIQKGDEAVTYLISGIYNSISFNGYNYTIIEKEVPVELEHNSGIFWAYSNDENLTIDEMNTKVKNLVGKELTVSRYDSNVKNMISTVSSFPMIIKSLLLVFLIISGVIILNSTIMDINNSNKVYGIMKSTGFSNRQITGILVIRTTIMTLVGAVLGFILNLLTMNMVMQGVFRVTPFSSIELPVIFDAVGSFVLLVLFIIIGIVGTLIPSRKIGRISPKQLIAE